VVTLFAAPIAALGLGWYLFSNPGQRFRPLAWMYLVPLALLVIAQGRAYYLAPAYPPLHAAGALVLDRALDRLRARRRLIVGLVWAALAFDATLAAAFTLPIAAPGSRWFWRALKVNGDMHEEIGWPELVQTVAQVRDRLPPEQRAGLAILASNYGEAGAVNLYGPAYGLPTVISGVNSFYARGYGHPPPQHEIVLGLPPKFLKEKFGPCPVVAKVW